MNKYLTIAATAFALAAGPASALSCLPTHPVAAFNAVSEAEESFVVLHGEFDFDVKKVPDVNAPPVSVKIPTQFKGKLLTSNGFTDEVDVAVTLALNCAGPWCARCGSRSGAVSSWRTACSASVSGFLCPDLEGNAGLCREARARQGDSGGDAPVPGPPGRARLAPPHGLPGLISGPSSPLSASPAVAIRPGT